MPSDPAATVNPAASLPDSALFGAIEKGDLAGVERALGQGASLAALNGEGVAPLQWAAMMDGPKVFMRLGELMGDQALFAPGVGGQMSVMDVAFASRSSGCALALIESGRHDFNNEEGAHYFEGAVIMDKPDVALALSKYFDMSEPRFLAGRDGGRTGLEMAASLGKPACVAALLAVSRADEPPGHFEGALLLSERSGADEQDRNAASDLLRAALALNLRAKLKEEVPEARGGSIAGPRI